jgi:ABC-type antimicrobial peptide transport system permease subunit
MALGATPSGIIRLVLSHLTLLVAVGIVIGASLALWASKFATALLYGLGPRDPVTLVGAAVTLAFVGALAGWLPAYRASRIDSAEVLRES